MRRPSGLPGRGVIIIGALVVLIVVLALVADSNETNRVEGPALSMHVTAEDGGRALYIWLSELGYDTRPLEYRTYELSDDIDALFVLAPSTEITEQASAEVLAWVEQGGTLLVVDDVPNQLFDDLDLGLGLQTDTSGEATPLQPIFLDPPLATMTVDTLTAFRLPGTEWVPLVGNADGQPFAAVSSYGQGRIHVLSSANPLTNAALGEADNAAFVQHVLAGIPPDGTVVFDEYHHGLTEHGTLTQRLVREPWGWAVLWTVVFTFAWLAFSGKRFGKALPQPPNWVRRSSGEYVTTLGAMLRRGKHDDWLRENYVAQVKRALGSRYRVRADQPAREFVAALSDRRADAAALAVPLERLEASQPLDETTTLALMREIEAIRTQMGGSR